MRHTDTHTITARRRSRSFTRQSSFVLALYLLLTLLMTWPLVTQLASAIPGDSFDGWQNVWNLWWMREAWLVDHASPYVTDLLYHPTGADLRFQTMAPFNGLTFLNVQVSLGLFPAYNAAALFSFVIGGYGAYLLALYALRRLKSPSHIQHSTFNIPRFTFHATAFTAGLIYAFSPYHFAHLLGHLQLISLQWIPFYLLFLLRGLDRAEWPGGRRQPADWLADAAKAGLFLILVGLCDWYYVFYCLLFSALLLAVRLAQRRLTWRGLRVVAGAGLLFGVTLAPLLLPMIRGAGSWTGVSLLRDYSETLNLSADLLAFVTPQPFHPLWGDWAAARSAAFSAQTPSEYVVFAGYTVLALAGIALLTIRKRSAGAGFWLLAAATFALLALGPTLHINGRTDLLPGGSELPLPYALLYRTVPFIKLSRSVSRLDVIVMLCLGVAAAYGVAVLADWLNARRRRLAAALPILAALLILGEFLPLPYPVSPPDTPAWYQALAQEPGRQAVLNLPANWNRPGYLLYQTSHGKPLSTGYVTRHDPQTLWERAPVIGHFRWLGPDIHTRRFDLSRQGLQVLHDLLDVGWVVLDRYKMPDGPERTLTEAYVQQIFGPTAQSPLYEDERLTVYRVEAPAERHPYLILTPDWPPRQTDDAGQVWRRLPAGQAAGLTLVNPAAGQLAIEIVAAAPAGHALRLLDAEGLELAAWPASGAIQTLRSPRLAWKAGAITLVLTHEGLPPATAVIHEINLLPPPP